MCKELIASAKQEDTFIACLHVDVAKESQENPHRKVELVVQTDASDVDFLVKIISNIQSCLFVSVPFWDTCNRCDGFPGAKFIQKMRTTQ